MTKILNGKYVLSLQVVVRCPLCQKEGMHLKNGKYGTFLSCDDYPSCSGSLAVSIKIEESIEHKHKRSLQ